MNFFTQLMMFLIFVVFPASWTAFAPVSRINMERNNGTVSVEVKRCMYFVVPYYTQHLSNVSKVRVESFQGEKQGFNSQRSDAENRPNRRGYSEDNSELVLSNRDGVEVRAPLDLAFHDTVQREVEDFIASGKNGQYSVNLAANRSMYLLSFPIVLLTLIYVLIQALAITRLILGNPYWPASKEFAEQMKELALARRDAARIRASKI